MKSKLIISAFSIALILMAAIGIKKGNDAQTEAETALKRTDPKALDSIINYRFTSYDDRFMFDNTVVVDENGKIIGKLILYTNQRYIDSFYNSNNTWIKTRLYDNLKQNRLRLLPNITDGNP